MIDEYLSLLEVPRRAPSVDYLHELHRAHVSKVVYSNMDILLGRAGSIDPAESARRVIDRRGGYCFHLNGALSWLLRELGFSVSLHRGYVYRRGDATASLNHLVLIVHDLGDVAWFTDAGLGDGIYDPLPLVPGVYRQGPFTYELGPAPERDGWRFVHDEQGSFGAMEFESAAATIRDFKIAHRFLSTSPESSFTHFLTAQVRLPDAAGGLRALTATFAKAGGRETTTFSTFESWRDFIVSLGLAPDSLAGLWEPSREQHALWLASLNVPAE